MLRDALACRADIEIKLTDVPLRYGYGTIPYDNQYGVLITN